MLCSQFINWYCEVAIFTKILRGGDCPGEAPIKAASLSLTSTWDHSHGPFVWTVTLWTRARKPLTKDPAVLCLSVLSKARSQGERSPDGGKGRADDMRVLWALEEVGHFSN